MSFLPATISSIPVSYTHLCGAPEEEQPEEQIDYDIAMVTDAGMIMDGGYSEVAWTAISKFGSEKGVSHTYYQ